MTSTLDTRVETSKVSSEFVACGSRCCSSDKCPYEFKIPPSEVADNYPLVICQKRYEHWESTED